MAALCGVSPASGHLGVVLCANVARAGCPFLGWRSSYIRTAFKKKFGFEICENMRFSDGKKMWVMCFAQKSIFYLSLRPRTAASRSASREGTPNPESTRPVPSRNWTSVHRAPWALPWRTTKTTSGAMPPPSGAPLCLKPTEPATLKPFIPHPTSYTLHPTPYTLKPATEHYHLNPSAVNTTALALEPETLPPPLNPVPCVRIDSRMLRFIQRAPPRSFLVLRRPLSPLS